MHSERMTRDDEGRDPMMQQKPKMASKRPGPRGQAWNRFSFITLRRSQPCQYLDLRLLAFRTETMHFCPLSHPLGGTLLWDP